MEVKEVKEVKGQYIWMLENQDAKLLSFNSINSINFFNFPKNR